MHQATRPIEPSHHLAAAWPPRGDAAGANRRGAPRAARGDRARRLGGVRLPHGRGQPLPAGVERLRRLDRARQRGSAVGAPRVGAPGRGVEELLDDRFARRGAYVVPAGEYDWSRGRRASSRPAIRGAWHPEDALFVPMRHRTVTCSASSRSTSPQAGGVRPTTSSTCSSRSQSTRRSRCSRRRRRRTQPGTRSRSSGCSPSRRGCRRSPRRRDPARRVCGRARRARVPERARGASRRRPAPSSRPTRRCRLADRRRPAAQPVYLARYRGPARSGVRDRGLLPAARRARRSGV